MSAPATVDQELAELRERYAELAAHHTRLLDLAARLRSERSKQEERVRASARRRWESESELATTRWMQQWVRRAQGPFTEVLYRIEQLGEKPKRAQLDDLRMAGVMARDSIKILTEGVPPADVQHARNRAEVTRLREYVLAAGRELHNEHGWVPDGPTSVGCTCPGCELIVGMDLVDGEAPA